MPFSNFFQSSSRAHEEHPELESRSSTPTPPTGVSTPRPDPTDKRSPGIFSTYFAQVGVSLTPSSSSAADMERHHYSQSSQSSHSSRLASAQHTGADEIHTAPSSRSHSTNEDEASVMLLSHERIDQLSEQKDAQKHAFKCGYPTPPASSSSSTPRPQSSADETSPVESGADNTVRAESPRRKRSLYDRLPAHIRRNTFTANPLSNVTTTSAVHASHFSNPGLTISRTNPSCPVVSRRPPLQHLETLLPPSDEHQGLTKNTNSSRNQSTPTPPRTPRTQSHETLSRASSPAATPNGHSKSRSKRSSNSATLGEPRGKLSICITEGRGLKPCVDPYVICQFQWNEYISKGPQGEGSSVGGDHGAEGYLSAMPIIRRTDSDMGRPMAIPMKSRQSSHTSMPAQDSGPRTKEVTDPVWNHEATFDVVGDQNEIDVSVYDHSAHEAFLGHVRFCPILNERDPPMEHWFRLEPRDTQDEQVSGEIRLRMKFSKVDKKTFGPEDFQILKLIGKGTFGQVFQVRKRDTQRVYAMKVLSKKVIVQKKEVAHTLGERNILVRTAMTESPFIVGLKFSFQTPADLYLVTDYMSGGELFWHLQKEGRFHEQRAKFYIAELILALQHLHQHDIVYRDLKPENILLDANGHIALCDFGLSKANLTKDETTNTFCGTTEYLAPEVLLDEQGYTKMVDFWSLGVLVFEMCCGWSPFYAEDTQQMYKNIAFGKVRFPRDALSVEGRNFVKGLLNRNPKHRLGATDDAEELKAHPFFADIDWVALAKKNVVPPFKPRLKSELDTSNFDPEFTNALNGAGSLNARAAAISSGIDTASTPLSPTVQANFKGFTFVDESTLEHQYAGHQDRMDEDERFQPLTPTMSRDDKMTGMHGGADEGMFNAEGL